MHKSALLMVVGVLGLAACQDRTNVAAPGAQSTEPTVQVPQQTEAVSSEAGELTLMQAGDPGPHLADAAGSALYALEGDVAGEGCTDRCLEVWPPMLVAEAEPEATAGLQPNLVSSVNRPDGTHQVTYANKPLYRYAGDMGAGRTTGHGVRDQWGHWSLIGPAGEPLEADQTQADQTRPDQTQPDQTQPDQTQPD